MSQRGDYYKEACDECEKPHCDDCPENQNPNLGQSMIDVIKCFLSNGFDLKRNNGQAGAQCLSSLVFTTFDKYMIDATKLLLNAGAENVCIADDDEETPLDSVGCEGSYQDTCCHNHHLGNIFEAMYQIYETLENGKPYEGIGSYELSIGKKIQRVLAETPEEGDVFFTLDLPTSKHKNCYTKTLYFVYDDGVLVSTKYADFWVDNIIPDIKLTDVSKHFEGIVGSTIKKFSFKHNEVVKGTTHYGQPVITIRMDNGKTITVTINFGEVENDGDRAAYYTIR